MKISIRKWIIPLLTLLLCIGLLPATVFADEFSVLINEENFPDAAFREYVQKFDTDKSDSLSNDELNRVTSIVIHREGVSSLKGVEYFHALRDLVCDENNLTSLDISENTNLELLSCDNNQLTSLNVRNNSCLQKLYCRNNQFTSLDLSQSEELTHFDCSYNQISSLDFSGNPVLEIVLCYYNSLETLDFSSNPYLKDVRCSNNKLTSLNISKNSALTRLECGQNQLTSLDPSHCPELDGLTCNNNQLTSLNISQNLVLRDLSCLNNQLTFLDIKGLEHLDSLVCHHNQIPVLDLSDASYLTHLQCQENKLTSLNLENCSMLEYVDCDENQLTEIQLPVSRSLGTLSVSNNQLTELDLSSLYSLDHLYCNGNRLTTLDVSHLHMLTYFHCFENRLTSLDLSEIEELEYFNAQYNRYPVSTTNNSVSLTQLPSGFSPDKASNWQGGTVQNGILTMNADQVTYDYDCGNDTTVTFTLVKHTHFWSDRWSYDRNYHWHECTNDCDITNNAEKSGYAEHVWQNGRCACGAREVPSIDRPDDLVFDDVPQREYFYSPVLWGLEHGIVSGTGPTIFSPHNSCTREQAVTFLWRANGSPMVNGDNPFSDVKSDDYFYHAVLWAVNKGITQGVSSDSFGAGQVCTRAQIVTFQYRAAGSPAASGSLMSDVSPNDYYANSVRWAVSNGVTVGTTQDTFSPDLECTRAQIITFIYRQMS